MLPRKATGLKQFRIALGLAAYQAGVLIAIERNRKGWTQDQLAAHLGIDQVAISALENGNRFPYNNQTVNALFSALDLPTDDERASFVKWWRDHSG